MLKHVLRVNICSKEEKTRGYNLPTTLGRGQIVDHKTRILTNACSWARNCQHRQLGKAKKWWTTTRDTEERKNKNRTAKNPIVHKKIPSSRNGKLGVRPAIILVVCARAILSCVLFFISQTKTVQRRSSSPHTCLVSSSNTGNLSPALCKSSRFTRRGACARA